MDYIRKTVESIPAKSTLTVNIQGQAVNYFRVVNSGNTSLYCGLSNMPTKNLYDFKVAAHEARMYCEEKFYNHLYIYNDGTEAATVILFAFKAPFEPTAMAFCDFASSQDNTQTVHVEIDGFTESLPTGNNKIGKVEVENLTSIAQDIASLPTTDYTGLLNSIITAIGTGGGGSSIDYTEILESIETATAKQVVKTSSGTITSGSNVTLNNVLSVNFITNDSGTDSLTIGFTTGTSPEQLITIQPGETLNDINDFLSATVKIYNNSENSIVYRCVYKTASA